MAINDWLIGNANDVVLSAFQDELTGDVENDVEAYLSLCEYTPHVITDVTDDTVSPIVVTSAAHGLLTGDKATIVNVGGNGAAKGTFTVTRLTADTFSLQGSTGDGDYTGGGEFYTCIPDASALPLSLVGDGEYLVSLDGQIPLTESQRLVAIIYCLGAYRDGATPNELMGR